MLVIVLAVGLCGVALWASHTGRGATAAKAIEAPEGARTAVDGVTLLDEHDSRPTPAAQRATARATDIAQEVAQDVGRIAVRVRREDGATVDAWTLEVENVAGAIAHALDATRSLEFTAPSIVFDAGLGSTLGIQAHATGFASATAWVRLTSAAPTADVELVLGPASAVEGRIVDDAGLPVADIQVSLAPAFIVSDPKSARTNLAISTRTNALGAFQTLSLNTGRWNLLVGDRSHPLARRNDIDIDIAGRRVVLEPLELPRTFELLVRVLDDHGARVPGARVSGSGTNGGAILLATDGDGEVRASRLPAGRYRVFADSPTRGRTNRVVEIPSESSIVLTLRSQKRP